ncbi:MAG: hypothetical protein EOO10_04140 [Chitinophagaceae bacterium]|nr:MAG: hypothetical protein EOO10_04140 [Chitinophagaceae bacterium]
MTSDLALDYISRRMVEMGVGKNYLLRFRHVLLKVGEIREVIAYNQIFLLIEPMPSIRIESDVGLFDLNEDQANEMQYEHRGRIRIANLSLSPTNARFLQAIPINTEGNASNERQLRPTEN